MKKFVLLTVAMLIPLLLSAQNIQEFVSNQLQTYPKSRLLDIYKSCFQNYMGAEHLITDKQRVKAYLEEEVRTTTLDDFLPWYYESCGPDSRYYRVSLRTIKEGIVTEDLLLDAFIRSANQGNHPSVESWRERWSIMVKQIDQMKLDLPNYKEDRQFIDSILSVGQYAISHSPEYRNAYHPRYRIVKRSVFEKEIRPLIDNYNNIHLNKQRTMKSFGSKPWILPQPVLIIGTYDKNGKPNAMNAAWGGQWDMHEIIISLGSHATTDNLAVNPEFTVTFATAETVVAADYVGIVSARNTPDKMEKTGWTIEKAPNVNAPVFKNFPMTLECRVKEKIDESETGYYLVAEIVNILCDEKFLAPDGNPDVEKMGLITFDPVHHTYIQLGKTVGKAFSDGKQLK